MAVVNKCCCCCQLRTGVIVVGWLGMIWALLALTTYGYTYANRYTLFYNLDPSVVVLFSYLPICITYAVVSVVMYILMIWGASIGNRFLLLPWLIMEMISIVIVGLGVVIGGIVCLAIDWDFKAIGALILGIGLPIFGFQLYIWLCVLSCFQELRDTPTVEQNVLLELPKPLDSIITDYRPPEYERLDNKDA
ncbi:uncharacterized protein [Anabrus simplex]|uniref:uncharacterized protein n=1 Tax=Anabrus simplex TaxID=316456 RepID=UPI0034DCCD6E